MMMTMVVVVVMMGDGSGAGNDVMMVVVILNADVTSSVDLTPRTLFQVPYLAWLDLSAEVNILESMTSGSLSERCSQCATAAVTVCDIMTRICTMPGCGMTMSAF